MVKCPVAPEDTSAIPTPFRHRKDRQRLGKGCNRAGWRVQIQCSDLCIQVDIRETVLDWPYSSY